MISTIFSAGVDYGSEFGSPFGGGGQTLNDLLTVFLGGSVAVASVVLLFLLVGGGLKMIQGAGSGDSKATAGGKDAITWALIGFALIVLAYFIIRIVEQLVGSTFLTAPIDNSRN